MVEYHACSGTLCLMHSLLEFLVLLLPLPLRAAPLALAAPPTRDARTPCPPCRSRPADQRPRHVVQAAPWSAQRGEPDGLLRGIHRRKGGSCCREDHTRAVQAPPSLLLCVDAPSPTPCCTHTHAPSTHGRTHVCPLPWLSTSVKAFCPLTTSHSVPPVAPLQSLRLAVAVAAASSSSQRPAAWRWSSRRT
jgi:hypothetical protein